MHTTPTITTAVPNPDPHTQLRELEAESRLVMLRVETKALETLEALMDDPESTGDAKKDAIVARERNRKRLAATQALTHIRAAQRTRHTASKARAKADKPTEDSQKVPLAACPPAPGLNIPNSPAEPTPPQGLTTLTLQEDWLRERKQAMARARAKQKSRKGRS